MTTPFLLEIPIPLCEKHLKLHPIDFIVHTCRNWYYLAIPVRLGSSTCRECRNELFIPSPYLRYADLRYADLRYADLSSADLSSADLRYADLRYADLSSADLSSADLRSADLSSADLRYAKNLEYSYWNKFTLIDKEFKELLNKYRFI